jgi:hypothetical protein
MPDALVLTQPPNVLNSAESGSWPEQTPYLFNSFSRSYPAIPASTQAIMFVLSTHLILFIRLMSTDTIILFSEGLSINAYVTLVPPP